MQDTDTPEGLAEYLDLTQNQGVSIFEMIGFRAQNAEAARITGLDFSFNRIKKISPII